MHQEHHGLRSSPAALRNRPHILERLRSLLKPGQIVLEIASGSGEHATFFGPALECVFQPSDPDPQARRSIAAWTKHLAVDRWVRPPLDLDVRTLPWPMDRADAVLSINMVHIAPLESMHALVTGASQLLGEDSPLVVYGPFKEGGVHTAESNRAFDDSLRARNPSWGVRDLDDLIDLAARQGMRKTAVLTMPSNNRLVVFHKKSGLQS